MKKLKLITGLSLGAGLLALTLLAPVMPSLVPSFAGTLLAVPAPRDIALLVVLATACTLFPFALSLVALRHMSAFAAQQTWQQAALVTLLLLGIPAAGAAVQLIETFRIKTL